MKLTVAFCLLLVSNSQAQQRVARHSAGVTSIYSTTTPFVDAYNDAIAGDTLYLPGGSMTAPGIIDKSLTIIGAGFHIDSTLATYQTKISNGFNFGENADGVHLEGVYFEGPVSAGTNISFNNAEIKRCYFNNSFNIAASSGNFTENLVVSECVFRNNLNLENTINCLWSNNIIEGKISSSSSNVFKNNIFLRNGGTCCSISDNTLYYFYNNLFENNVFYNSTGFSVHGDGNSFQRNLFVNAGPNLGTAPINLNNYFGIAQASVFVNQVGFTWLTSNDNHLQDPVTYFGTDATPVGIYGGFFPFKVGAVPQNPHISAKTISNQTDVNGDLNIQILTGAQDN